MPELAPSDEYVDVARTLRLAYDRAAEERDSSAATGWKVEECDRFLATLRHEERRTLLEVGAGSGHCGKFFLDEGLHVTCTDLSEENVRRCRAKGLTAEFVDFLSLSLDFSGRTFRTVFAELPSACASRRPRRRPVLRPRRASSGRPALPWPIRRARLRRAPMSETPTSQSASFRSSPTRVSKPPRRTCSCGSTSAPSVPISYEVPQFQALILRRPVE